MLYIFSLQVHHPKTDHTYHLLFSTIYFIVRRPIIHIIRFCCYILSRWLLHYKVCVTLSLNFSLAFSCLTNIHQYSVTWFKLSSSCVRRVKSVCPETWNNISHIQKKKYSKQSKKFHLSFTELTCFSCPEKTNISLRCTNAVPDAVDWMSAMEHAFFGASMHQCCERA